MLAKKYKSRIVSISNPFKDIYTIDFQSLGSKYKFQPGQFLHIAIDENFDGSGQWPDSRCFSMQSNPSEDIIRITYAVKGDFTKRMEQSLRINSNVWLKLPYGDLFTQNHNKNNTVFISGGTGITPCLSLFTHETFKEYSKPRIYLGSVIKFYYQDKDGIIDIEKIFMENGISSDYFISGPPIMIKTFKTILINKGISPSSILTDDWE